MTEKTQNFRPTNNSYCSSDLILVSVTGTVKCKTKITQLDMLCVDILALVTQHAMPTRLNVTLSVARLTVQYFPHYLINI
jgi:hypothetical protein